MPPQQFPIPLTVPILGAQPPRPSQEEAILQQLIATVNSLARDLYSRAVATSGYLAPFGSSPADLERFSVMRKHYARQSLAAAQDYFSGLGLAEFSSADSSPQTPDTQPPTTPTTPTTPSTDPAPAP
jgi:hypothetical protein